MGKSVTPKYRKVLGGRSPDGTEWLERSAWRGKATPKRLQAYVMARIESEGDGGCNRHLALQRGWIINPSWAQIIDQREDRVVARWRMPAFMAI